MYFFEAKNPCFVTKNCWKCCYICVFILFIKQLNWFHKNLYNSGMVGRRKLPNPSLNHIFNALSIAVKYTLSFQLTNFGLKCLLEDYSFLEHVLDMILHQHQIPDWKRPTLVIFRQFLIQINLKRGPEATGVAWVQFGWTQKMD